MSSPIISGNNNEEDDGRVVPRDVDVLCRRGGEPNHHIGTLFYRQMVQEQKLLYASLPERSGEKLTISNNILVSIRQRGGRFLKYNEMSGTWSVLVDNEARGKISQALREGQSVLRALIRASTDVPPVLNNQQAEAVVDRSSLLSERSEADNKAEAGEHSPFVSDDSPADYKAKAAETSSLMSDTSETDHLAASIDLSLFISDTTETDDKNSREEISQALSKGQPDLQRQIAAHANVPRGWNDQKAEAAERCSLMSVTFESDQNAEAVEHSSLNHETASPDEAMSVSITQEILDASTDDNHSLFNESLYFSSTISSVPPTANALLHSVSDQQDHHHQHAGPSTIHPENPAEAVDRHFLMPIEVKVDATSVSNMSGLTESHSYPPANDEAKPQAVRILPVSPQAGLRKRIVITIEEDDDGNWHERAIEEHYVGNERSSEAVPEPHARLCSLVRLCPPVDAQPAPDQQQHQERIRRRGKLPSPAKKGLKRILRSIGRTLNEILLHSESKADEVSIESLKFSPATQAKRTQTTLSSCGPKKLVNPLESCAEIMMCIIKMVQNRN